MPMTLSDLDEMNYRHLANVCQVEAEALARYIENFSNQLDPPRVAELTELQARLVLRARELRMPP